MHEGICGNPLDMSLSKFKRPTRKTTATKPPVTRDLNPLGLPLKRGTSFQVEHNTMDLLEGKVDREASLKKNKEILHKYARLVIQVISTLVLHCVIFTLDAD